MAKFMKREAAEKALKDSEEPKKKRSASEVREKMYGSKASEKGIKNEK